MSACCCLVPYKKQQQQNGGRCEGMLCGFRWLSGKQGIPFPESPRENGTSFPE
jgi:hypothetical protein